MNTTEYIIILTAGMIREICPQAPRGVDAFIPYLNKYLPEYGINTKEEVHMFLAQIAHESGQFRYTQEIASGRAYEGRKDLGNIYPGDGVRFKGRGLIQLTGRNNYKMISQETGIDFVSTPDLLSAPQFAVMSACWYWKNRGLDKYSNDIVGCTKKINGGINGLDDRKIFYERAKKVIV